MFVRNYLLGTYAQRLLTNETVGGITVVQIEVKIIYRFSHLARATLRCRKGPHVAAIGSKQRSAPSRVL